MKAGLVTVSFRKLSAREVVERSAAAGLSCLEWGGDVHVPHGDVPLAQEVGTMTRDRGLEVRAYGSYYRLGQSEDQGLSFRAVLDSALALGAPSIRVWAGAKASEESDPAHRDAVVKDALRVADLAAAAGLTIGYEMHAHTLTDSLDSTRALLDATVHPAIQCLWQPASGLSDEQCLETIDAVTDRLAQVHVYEWKAETGERRPLAEGRERWTKFFSRMRQAGCNPDVLLEFVQEDDPDLLNREAATLREFINSCG